MKIISIGFYFFLLSNSTYAQIDYSYFKQTWCKCLPDSGAVVTDTLTYRIKSEACKTTRYGNVYIHLEQQEYTFEKKNSVHVYEAGGNSLRKDYVPEVWIEVKYKTNAEGDTIGIDSTYNMMRFAPGLSGCTLGDFKYQLNKSKNTVTIYYFKERREYEIIFLSSKMLLMRKIN